MAGELLLIVNVTGVAGGGFTSGGWTQMIDESAPSPGSHVWYKSAAGGDADPSFVSTNSVKSASVAYRISGWDGAAVVKSNVTTGTSDAPDPGNCNPGAIKDFLWLAYFVMAISEADDDTWTNNAEPGYSGLVQSTTGIAGSDGAVATCTRTSTATSEDAAWPAGSTDASAAWRAFTLAIGGIGSGPIPTFAPIPFMGGH